MHVPRRPHVCCGPTAHRHNEHMSMNEPFEGALGKSAARRLLHPLHLHMASSPSPPGAPAHALRLSRACRALCSPCTARQWPRS